MNYKMILRILCPLLLIEAAAMLPGVLISVYINQMAAVYAYLETYAVIGLAAALCWYLSQNAPRGFYARDGLATTGIAWIVLSMIGCLPFWFSREIPHYVDCLFEMVSGFTTTGSSILTNVEGMSKGLLYWRSFSHWLGGMGILVFLLAIVPLSGKNEGFTLHILRAESPGPSVGKLVPRMKQTAIYLYAIYFALTVLNIAFLKFGGMSWFDSFCTAFGTAGTGGFGVRNDSLAGYSPYLQNVTTVFMLLFGVNFSCYYLLLLGHFKDVIRDTELNVYICIVVASTAMIALNIHHLYATVGETIRHAAFQVATIITTTGFATTDFDLWPSFSKAILLILMLVGASAGSTGGGLKVARVVLLFKELRRSLHENLHPREVRKLRVNGQVVDEKVIRNLNGYLIAYVGIIVISFLIISLDGFSIETNISAVFATFNNIGPGFGAVGPTCNFYAYSDLSKLVLIFNMLAGRLEIFPILVLFSRTTWAKH